MTRRLTPHATQNSFPSGSCITTPYRCRVSVSIRFGTGTLLAGGTGLWTLRHSGLPEAMDEACRQRTRFLAICACAAAGFFLLAMLAHDVPVFVLSLGAR